MTTIEQEHIAPVRDDTRWEARAVPADFEVRYQIDPEADPDDPLTIEAYWDGEAKVAAEIDDFEGVTNIDVISRPAHWGEDSRPAYEQRSEYVLGLDGILSEVMRSPNNAIEFNNQKGVVAEALMTLKIPAGWKKSVKLVAYDSWVESSSINIEDAVAEGAVISLRYERAPNPNPGLGFLAIEGARTEANALAA